MKSLDICELNTIEIQDILSFSVAPRPMALVSTLDAAGNAHLEPFSFFNVFSLNPPLCIFSSPKCLVENTNNPTLDNILKLKECVINMLDYQMVNRLNSDIHQAAQGIDGWIKSGVVLQDADLVKPPRVMQSPLQLECVVNHVIPLGDDEGAAGNLVLAEVKKIHISEHILDENGKINQQKTDWVAKLGGHWYLRVKPENLFEMEHLL